MEPDIVMINKYFDRESKDKQKELYENVVNGFLKDKTVIYTSNINLIVKQSQRVIVLKNGEVVEDGTYDYYMGQRKSALYEVIIADSSGSSNFLGKILEGVRLMPKKHKSEKEKSLVTSTERINNDTTLKDELYEKMDNKMNYVLNHWVVKTVDMNRGKNLREEEEFVLNNRKESFKLLFTASGCKPLVFAFLIFLSTDIALVSINVWFGLWSSGTFNFTYQQSLNIFAAILVGVASLVFLREMIFKTLILRNLTFLYSRSVTSIL